MKKLLCLALLVCLLFSCAVAETIDLSSMSFDDLKVLQQALSMEIIKRPEWKEVIVPPGEYYVGVDIPAGRYTVFSTRLTVGLSVYADKKAKSDTLYDYYIITSDNGSAVINLSEGNIVSTTAESRFTPFIGLGF